MSYYFSDNTGKKPNRKNIHFRFLGTEEMFISDDGIFSKDTLDFGSRVLLETIVKEELKGEVLDLGCGAGFIGVLLKKYCPDCQITMVDVNETAVALARENSELYHQDNQVFVSDGFASIEEMRFDAVVTNPPIRTGKTVIYRLFQEAVAHLNENGRLYIVIRKQQGAESAQKYLNTLIPTEVICKEKGYWILRGKIDSLTD